MAPKTAEVLVEVAVMAAIRHPLTYRVPDSIEVRAGQRVVVPLGTRRAIGIILEPAGRPAPGVRVRDILRVVDPEPLLSPDLSTLGHWIAEYYLAPIGEVFRAMLPLRSESVRARVVSLTEAGKQKLEELRASFLEEARKGIEADLLGSVAARALDGAGVPVENLRRKFGGQFWELLTRAEAKGWVTVARAERQRKGREIFAVQLGGPGLERRPRLSPAAQRIMDALERGGSAEDHRALLKAARATFAHLRKLGEAGFIELSSSARGGGLSGEKAPDRVLTLGELPGLTAAQAGVYEQLREKLDAETFGVVLLHGITASGKTEIYLRLIARCLEQGRTALMLVPEIALTPAVQEQFMARFGGSVAVLHSGLGESERHEEWWRIRRGEARVVLGTRSAVFAPMDHLGVILVDEEHDSSYKQQETPRYHGRDVAVVRARLANSLVVLGSATPSLESYWNAREGKYHLLKLEERIGGRPLASVEIVDMREEFRATVSQVPISRRLKDEIEAQLGAGAQTMILLNRRGYSWFLLCRSCGQSVRCVNCSISLTYHRREHRLICHYCGYTSAVPSRCPACDSEFLHYVGEGTEKIEVKLAEMFGGARLARLDRDVARRPGQFAKILSDFSRKRIDILVGTQLVAKGHDFPGVTLVGVVSVDQGLGLPDFRAAERTFQLLTQAAGRAGRGEAPGRVLVQTFFPEHYAVRLAADQNYEAFFAKEMRFRRAMHYPPPTALANIIAQDPKLENAARVAKRIENFFADLDGDSKILKVLGPTPPPLAKLEGKFRIQFLVKSASRARLNSVLQRLVAYSDQVGIAPRSLMIDVDPVSVM